MIYLSDIVDEETNSIIGELVDEFHETGDSTSLRHLVADLDDTVVKILENQIGERLR